MQINIIFNKVKFDPEGQAQSVPPKKRDLEQNILHFFWSKFGDSSSNLWRVIVLTSSWLTDTRTHGGNDNTRRPKLASGKKPYLTELINPIIDNFFVLRLFFYRHCMLWRVISLPIQWQCMKWEFITAAWLLYCNKYSRGLFAAKVNNTFLYSFMTISWNWHLREMHISSSKLHNAESLLLIILDIISKYPFYILLNWTWTQCA